MPKSGMSFSIIDFVAAESGNLKILTDTCPGPPTADRIIQYRHRSGCTVYIFQIYHVVIFFILWISHVSDRYLE
jgi:hypothetical protein